MPDTRVERDAFDCYRLVIMASGAFGTEEISIHEAQAARLIEQIRDALKVSAFEVHLARQTALAAGREC